jgi:phenylalanine ammonia-lyase
MDDPLYNHQNGLPTEGKKTIGSWVGIVYENLLEGDMMHKVLENWVHDKAE